MSKILGKLGRIPWWAYYITIFVTVIIPMIFPLGLPLLIEPMTQRYFDVLDTAPAGTIVLYSSTQGFDSEKVTGPITEANLKLLAKNNIKFVYEPWSADGAIYAAVLIDRLNLDETYGLVYGEDYVLMPFLAGMESAMAAGASDFRVAYSQDHFGHPINSLPLMENLYNIDDVDFVIWGYTHCTHIDIAMRQYYTLYGKELITYTSGCASSAAPYFDKGVIGFADAAYGAAQLEILGEIPGSGLKRMDPRTLTILTSVVFVVIANIGYFADRQGRKN